MPRCSRRLWTAFAALVGVGVCHGFTSVVSRWPSSTAACRRGTFGVESRRQPNKHLVPPLRCAFNEEGVGNYGRAGLQKMKVIVGSTDLQNAALMAAALASFAAIVMYADPDLIPALRDKCSSAHFLHFELQAAKDNGLQAFTCFSVSDLICQYGIKAEKEGDDGKAVSSGPSFAHLDVSRALRAGVLGIFINACGYGFFISHLDQVYPHEVCILADTVSCTFHCLFHLPYAHVQLFYVHTAKLTSLDNSHLLCSCDGSTTLHFLAARCLTSANMCMSLLSLPLVFPLSPPSPCVSSGWRAGNHRAGAQSINRLICVGDNQQHPQHCWPQSNRSEGARSRIFQMAHRNPGSHCVRIQVFPDMERRQFPFNSSSMASLFWRLRFAPP